MNDEYYCNVPYFIILLVSRHFHGQTSYPGTRHHKKMNIIATSPIPLPTGEVGKNPLLQTA